MINNVNDLPILKFQVNKLVANYLIYEKHLPLLGISEGRYFFAVTDNAREVFKNLPLWLRVVKLF
jgi:hypothetical protein